MKLQVLLLSAGLLVCSLMPVSAQILTYSSSNSGGPSSVPTNLLTAFSTLTAQSGSFGQEGTGPIGVLTDSLPGASSSPSAWDAIGDGASLTYTLNTTTNTAGYTINAIDLVSGWGDFGRANVTNVTVSYQLVGGGSFTTLLDGSTIADQGLAGGGAGVYEDVNYSNGGAALISGVQAIKFDFGAQQNGYVGYRELDIQGIATAVPEPTTWTMLLGSFACLILVLRRRNMYGLSLQN